MIDSADRQAVIEVENLVTHYGARAILQGVNLTVKRGEVMVIMGGSGSGKSTFLRSLLGLKQPTSGTIRLLGKELTRRHRRDLLELRKNMGVAFQGEHCSVP